ncbi:hypothetical protein F3K39_19180 [Streptomyces sp. LBUM 1479]|uniref:hypothetical protein n=1 Tax=Streptomyces scabiei TaxID=1930 RepID=UPI001B31260B|nr:hypothetical protein [Streptomyces sp. LBUM 1475]MBP5930190.1 hypothetical protein [Streptomyces sp. LBUM 1479]QTU63125.1 hypothetical protein F3K22_20770 [Streptomyces sp. LBUM 1475]
MALSGTLLAVSAFAELTQALDLGSGKAAQSLSRKMSLASGTGAGKADRVFSDRRTLAASATEDLDLAGVLLDAFGQAITFARVKGLIVAATAANTNNVVIGNASSNAWAALLGATGTAIIRPGAFIALGTGEADAVGYAVTAGTGDQLKVANSAGGTPVTYDIHIIGASA